MGNIFQWADAFLPLSYQYTCRAQQNTSGQSLSSCIAVENGGTGNSKGAQRGAPKPGKTQPACRHVKHSA